MSARSRQGILHASLRDESGGGGGGGGGGHHYRNFCIKFYPQVYNLSRRLEDASVFDLSSLLDVSSAADDVNTCSEGHQLDALDGRVALVADRRENCSISQRAELAQVGVEGGGGGGGGGGGWRGEKPPDLPPFPLLSNFDGNFSLVQR